jgi:integrase
MFHDMRHTEASLLLSKGFSVVAVSRRLGHAKPSITHNVYGHCLPTDDAQLAEGLHRMMG